MSHVLEVKNLHTEFPMREKTVYAVNGVSYYIDPGEIVGIVGESGCGKSVTQMSAVQLVPYPGKVTQGQAVLEDKEDLLQFSPKSELLQSVRGTEIAMIFQEPMTSLNPVLTIGEQIAESLIYHKKISKQEAKIRTIELMKLVGIPDAEKRYTQYPHEFSGGMCQRIMIAIAISCNPKLLVADEATTALDVTTQAQILETLQQIVRKTNMALIIVTHNLGIVARYADRIYVMYAGRVIESGTAERIFSNPSHVYTLGLLQSVPRLDDDKSRNLKPIDGLPPRLNTPLYRCPFYDRCTQRLPECENAGVPELWECEKEHFTACLNRNIDKAPQKGDTVYEKKTIGTVPLLEVKNLCKSFSVSQGFLKKPETHTVLENVSFQVFPGETLGVVGESGCGKTTIAKCILKLYQASGGSIFFEGKDILHMKETEFRSLRKDIQFIFQDPFGSLDPRMTIADIIGDPLKIHHLVDSKQAYVKRVKELFRMVELDEALWNRMPHELSGGQRQRVGIARAFASNPKLIICDEPVSALDVSVQAQILNLFERLQRKTGISYLFIAHDLSVVRHISDRIAVIYLGNIVEIGSCDKVCDTPRHPYTRALLSAVPIPDPAIERQRQRQILLGEMPSILHRPNGCCFAPRCRYAKQSCTECNPVLQPIDAEHASACCVRE